MRFMTRSLIAIVLLALTLGLLGTGASQIRGAIQERAEREGRQRPAREREFSVNVEVAKAQSVSPVITAFGDVASWRTLELRASGNGRLVKLADRFRDGDMVRQGDLLFQVDPTEAQAAFDLAQTRVLDAAAELADARAALSIAQAELTAASEQLELREQALSRAKDLRERGVGSEAAVETANLSRSSAVQTELARKQALAQAQARIARAEISESRERISLAEAERHLTETSVYAPFDGVLQDVSAVQGRLVNANEKLAELIDPGALEVAFRVSNTQFARLIDDLGIVQAVPIRATLDLDGAPVTVSGKVERVGAVVGEGQTGRLIYASLDTQGGQVLRPGDFMRVEITERPLDDVYVVPATASSSDGRMLIVQDGDRLEAQQVTILRRQADSLIVAGLPEGSRYVTRLQPQLGAGVKVKAFAPDAGLIEAEMVELAPERRDRLIAAVEGNAYIPADRKARILAQLREEKVSADVVARLEARMGGGGGGDADDGAKIALAEPRRAALIAFVEANERMPAAAKEGVLAQLREPEVSEALVKRLEGRMGGGGGGGGARTSDAAPAAEGDTIALDEGRRARLVAFVEANERMPAEAKARVLGQLQADQVPAALVTRLEARAGG